MKFTPCWGFIGPWDTESGVDLSKRFKNFYNYIFTRKNHERINLGIAIRLLHINDYGPDYILNFYNSEDLFDKIWRGIIKTNQKEEWLDRMTRQALKKSDISYYKKTHNHFNDIINRWDELGEDFKLFFTGKKGENEKSLLREITENLFKN